MKPLVVFVDDEKNVLSAMERYLIREDYRQVFCNSASDALKIFAREEVHLIVSDLRMPEMNGLELLKAIREEYPETIRMVLSGTSDSNMVIDAINNGEIFRYLTKPLAEVKELRAIIRQALDFYALKKREKLLVNELALKNSELMAWKKRMAYELEVAEKLQRKLLETGPIEFGNLQALFAYQPCWSIGGDFFDLIKLPEERLCIYIGDVSGHGVGSALISTLLKLTASDMVRQHYQEGPAAICCKLNAYMNSHFHNAGCFATFLLAFLNPATGSWNACNCGHPPPFIFSGRDAVIDDRISSMGCLPLGFFDDPSCYVASSQIEWQTVPGEVLFLFTDGLYEARNDRNEILGFDGLKQIAAERLKGSKNLPDPAEIIKNIEERGFDCSGDDCCAILLKHE